MKKLMFILPLMAFSSAYAADGTINFVGEITGAACTVDMGAGSSSQTVSMGTINTSSFDAAGAVIAPTKFDITLTNCDASLTSVNVTFDGPTNETNSDLLALSTASTATGVAVGIYENDSSTQIPIATRSANQALNAGADTTLSYIAKYVSTAASVTAGTANASTNFTISYN